MEKVRPVSDFYLIKIVNNDRSICFVSLAEKLWYKVESWWLDGFIALKIELSHKFEATKAIIEVEFRWPSNDERQDILICY